MPINSLPDATREDLISLIETIFRTRLAEKDHKITSMTRYDWAVDIGIDGARLELKLLPITLTPGELEEFVRLLHGEVPSTDPS